MSTETQFFAVDINFSSLLSCRARSRAKTKKEVLVSVAFFDRRRVLELPDATEFTVAGESSHKKTMLQHLNLQATESHQ